MKENIMPNGEKSNRNIPLANPFLNVVPKIAEILTSKVDLIK